MRHAYLLHLLTLALLGCIALNLIAQELGVKSLPKHLTVGYWKAPIDTGTALQMLTHVPMDYTMVDLAFANPNQSMDGLSFNADSKLASSVVAQAGASSQTIRTGIFPFYPYVRSYDMWQFVPMDQGGREIQLQLIGSEKDADIVRAVRAPGYLSAWGSPSPWDALEKTELEKSVWASRWYYLPSFAREYYLTGDKTYLQDMMRLIRQWRDDNPPPDDLKTYFAGKHYNWRDMQVAWRMQNLCWSYFLAEKGLTPAEKSELFALINTHARVLLAYFGTMPLNEFNHQSHGAEAMLYASLLFPDIDNAAAMRTRAFEILNHHLYKAFYDDGDSVELDPGYYPFFVSIFRDSYLLCSANHVAPPPRTLERLHQFYDFLGSVQQPDGTAPPINDSSESDMIIPQQILGSILRSPPSAAQPASHWFQVAQQGVMRDADPHQPIYAFLDAGPRIAEHWHGGKLGFHLWFWDHPVLLDSGISDYDDPLKRSWYVTPEAHNTLLVDGKGDVDPEAARGAKQQDAGSRIDQWESNPTYDWAVMCTTAFQSLPSPVQWTRHFILLKGVGALVIDQLTSSSEHDYTWLFHLPPGKPQVDEHNKSVLTAFPENNLLLQPAGSRRLDSMEIAEGTINIRSRNMPAPVIHYLRRGNSLTQAYLLLPIAGSAPQQPRVTLSIEGEHTVVKLALSSGVRQITLARTRDSEKAQYSLSVHRFGTHSGKKH
jgi:hypothetical protein